MADLQGRAIAQKFLELHGQFGEFDISTKKFKVRYFSTFASSKNKLHDSYNLLKELKPMRERVKASQISDLNSLMQRDLNDFRVANELIPYLINDRPEVSFFPAVLAVLIPKGFISQNDLSNYPLPKNMAVKEGDNSKVSYDDFWNYEVFKIGGQDSTLGILGVNPDKVDIIVLDGQHRANAFRVVTGTFENAKNSIYSAFYKNINEIEGFNADLPVTIVWFDNEEQNFDPKIVSRKLFVDVNNSAKKVSRSRTILLDEHEVPSLLTRFFYSKLADERQFRPDKFSLFHSDFDLDSDIQVSANNSFAITNPQIIYDVFSWLTLGRTEQYNELKRYGVGREAYRNALDKFGKIFDNTNFSHTDIFSDEESPNRKKVIIKDVYKIDVFQQSYSEVLGSVMFKVFSEFNFYKPHFQASKIIADSYSEQMDHTEMDVWDNVFMGGEGLYYTFRDKDLRERNLVAIGKYVKAIDEIEASFKEKRSEEFEDIKTSKVNSAYESANSKAFQIALFMALDFYSEDEPLKDHYLEYISLLNSKSSSDWVYILTDIRQNVIKGTDPKKWPAYQKIIIRAIQNKSFICYDSDNFADSPDGVVFKAQLKNYLDSWLEINDEIDYDELTLDRINSQGEVNKWINAAQEYTEALFNKAHIAPIDGVQYKEIAISYLNKLLSSLISN